MSGLIEVFEWLLTLPKERQKELIRWILEQLDEGLSILDEDLRYVYVNKVVLQRRESTLEDFIGRHITEVHLNLKNSERFKAYQRVLETGEPVVFEKAGSDHDTRFFKVTAFRLGYQLCLLTKDLTRDIDFENTIIELHRHADQLQHAESLEKVYKITLDVMNSVLGFGTYDILMRRGEKLVQVMAWNLPIGEGVPFESNGVTIRALLGKKTMMVDDLRLDENYYKMIDPDTGNTFEGYSISQSELATPIIVDGDAIGVLNVEHPEPNQFNQQDAIFLELLAIHVAGAIKRLRDLAAIIEQESKFTNFAENSQDGVWMFDYEQGYTYVNPSLEALLGYPRDQMLGDTLFVYNHLVDEDKPILREITESAQKGEFNTNRVTLRFKHRDGHTLHLEQWIHPLRDADGKITGFYGSSRDITRQVTYRENLKALNEHATQLVETESVETIARITLGILENILHTEFASFQILESNTLLTILTLGFPSTISRLNLDGPGVTAKAAREKRSIILSDVSEDPDFIGRDRLTNSELAVPVIIGNKVFAVINIEDHEYDYYSDEDRQFVELLAHHVASAIQRIETRKEYLSTQERLIEEQVKLERAKEMDEIKNRFISTATHEIRTPLTSIKGYTEIIGNRLEENRDQEINEFFKVISRNIERLEHLTNDLLDIQRIENKRMTINIEPSNIKTLIKDVRREMAPLLTAKNQEIKVKNEVAVKTIPLDKLRIHQVLINLLQNASRYSLKNSTITLSITEKPTEIIFNVTDHGHGIRKEDLGKLFTAFPDIVYTDMQRGTGLGLAICKGIIDLHKGKIWAESEGLGKGMSITFTLPKP